MKCFTPLSFLSRFTPEEQAAIILSTVPQVQIFRYLFGIADRILSTDPRLEQGRQILIATGLLTPERAAEVFDFTTAPLP
jgi:hypothetical protein